MTVALPARPLPPPPATAAPRLASVAVRWAAMAAALVLVAFLFPRLADGYLVAAVLLVGIALDHRHPCTLRNYFVLYSVGLFLVGNLILYPGSPRNTNEDLVVYLAAFLLAYHLYGLATARQRAGADVRRRRRPLGPGAGRRLEAALVLLGLAQVVRLAALIAPLGLRQFYGGRELVNRIEAYASSGSTTQTTINLLLTVLVAATVTLYAEHCIRTGARIRYPLLAVVLVGLPALSLQRAALVYHSVLLAVVYLYDRRVRPRADDVATARSRRRLLPAAVVLAGAVVAAVVVGDIRAKELRRSFDRASSEPTLVAVLRAEFTPIVFYRDATENIDRLGYRNGTNIWAAFATRLVPRSFWPGKPITTTEYYMRELRPGELDAGFSLAPSVFGVGFLNFGLAGCALLVAVFGWMAAYLDQAFVRRLEARMPLFLIVSTWAYSLLRDDLATSLFSVVLTIAVYRVARLVLAASPAPALSTASTAP